MKPVVQEEKTGCAITCAATVTGVPYVKARTVAASLGIYVRDTALWTETTHIRLLLEAFGLAAAPGETSFRSWGGDLPDLCLLAIKWRMQYSRAFWHWAVFHHSPSVGSVVLDPKKSLVTNTRRDFGRMKPRWYIPVSKDR